MGSSRFFNLLVISILNIVRRTDDADRNGETVLIYRKFCTFRGRYVCHCHNLAHEDHALMFGWQIV